MAYMYTGMGVIETDNCSIGAMATWEFIADIMNPGSNPPMWHATSWCATQSGKNCGSPSLEDSAREVIGNTSEVPCSDNS